jgi:hypothetical protein
MKTIGHNVKVDASRIECPELDPIIVITEDIRPSVGKLYVECFGLAWSAFWDGMNGKTVAEFVADCSGPDYIAGCLARPRPKITKHDERYLTRISEAVIDFFKQQQPTGPQPP